MNAKKTAKDKNINKKSRFEELYFSQLRPKLKEQLNFSNLMQVPKLEKIVLNIGVKEAVADSRILNTVMQTLDRIANQKSVKTLAKKSIAGFKIREGMPIGIKVTLRKQKMYDFFDKLINLALPKVRDFQGLSVKFDGRGNYNLGIKEWNIFPEVDPNIEKIFGLNITVHTSAGADVPAYELLKSFGFPFKRQ